MIRYLEGFGMILVVDTWALLACLLIGIALGYGVASLNTWLNNRNNL